MLNLTRERSRVLSRRRYPERHDCWHVYCGDVHVGTIARRLLERRGPIGNGAVESGTYVKFTQAGAELFA
jgi:hypothetical protein